jgi:uncharacterized protein YndB with AHSA1/START domain
MATENTVRLHRVMKAPAERVYRAFLEPEAVVKWLPPHGFVCKVLEMDVRVGGSFRMAFTNFSTGSSHIFGGKYHELVPHERIMYVERFEVPALPEEMRTTIVLRAVKCGTELNIAVEGQPEAIPLDLCYLGWQESLVQLSHLVEPVISDEV